MKKPTRLFGLDMAALLELYPPPSPPDREVDRSVAVRGRDERRDLATLAPQASIDLHGLRAHEAEAVLLSFLSNSARLGLRKLLIVHGKGNHSGGGGVLPGVVRRVLEQSPLAGSFEHAERKWGGRGATVVVLRGMGRA